MAVWNRLWKGVGHAAGAFIAPTRRRLPKKRKSAFSRFRKFFWWVGSGLRPITIIGRISGPATGKPSQGFPASHPDAASRIASDACLRDHCSSVSPPVRCQKPSVPTRIETVADSVIDLVTETRSRSYGRPSLGKLWRMLETAVREDAPAPGSAAWIQTRWIDSVLRRRQIRPSRIGIDGLPGSGKSSLACALASVLGMRWRSLDYEDLESPGLLDETGLVFEHHRLLRTQDVDRFDAIVYIDEPIERSWSRVVDRGRGMFLGLMLDYRKLKAVGKAAFDLCDGERITVPKSDIHLKLKPSGGFRVMENLTARLRASRLDATGANKEEKLLLLICGERQQGLRAYLLGPTRIAQRFVRLVESRQVAP